MEPAPIVCFECGQGVTDPPTLHVLPDGRNCRRCADRVLASQPGIFHEPWVDHGSEVLEGLWSRQGSQSEPGSEAEGSGPEPPARA